VTSPELRPKTPEHLVEKIHSARAALEGERKQVTVLFADVRGSMELAEQTDPEQWRAIMDRFFALLCAGVHRFEGTVDKFTGDGIMAIFGAPIAHEDHARRACYAALHLQRELASYVAELRRTHGLSFSVRIGLNSGEVVVGAIGEDLAMAYTAVGHTVGLAQRMEQLAAPDRIYLSEHTAALAEGYFALEDLGEFQVKGASKPLRVHELTGTGAARGALDVARARGLTRFVGRTEELLTLESALERSFAGEGQVVGVAGEAGVGKSRLCHELAERCRAKGIPVYHVAAQAHAKSVPLMPLLRFLREYFEISERDPEQTARERIAGKLLLLDKAFDEELPLIFDFLAVPDPERPVEGMDPEARQRRLLALMGQLTYARSAREPGLIVFEDLHWLDPASEVFLINHVETVQGTRGLTVVNFRPEYRVAWMSRSYYCQIALAPLGEEAVEELLADLLGSDPSLDGLQQLVRERTQGNPFFIEELVRALIEAGRLEGERGAYRLAAPIDEVAVPASVQVVLAARIDRLAAREKGVLQAAAVIGKEFPQSVLERVVELEAPELEDALRDLVAREFAYEQELYPEALYAFKHPLTQEVAYGSQLKERRAEAHAAVARAIVEHYPRQLEERAALVAGHWEAAGEISEAARWHARAAAWSGYNDPTEALRHWCKVRELADALPESAETVALGVKARILSLQLGWRLGISLEEAEAIFSEGERIASGAGDVRSRALLLAAYGAVKGLGHGELREWAELARQSIALAGESGDPALYVAAATGATYVLQVLGEYREGIAILDRALELAHGDPAAEAGNAAAFCHVLKGGYLMAMGELAEAHRLTQLGRELAPEHRGIETVRFSHWTSVSLAFIEGEPETALAHARQALASAERTGDAFSRAWGWLWLGMAEVMRGEWERAIEAIERSRAISRERQIAVAGHEATRLALLAEARLGLGEVERAQALAAEAVDVARSQGTAPTEASASLSLARVLLGSVGPAARERIELALARALELIRERGARDFEPMIHLELAELARQLGDEPERERELREAYRLFTEIGATGRAEWLAAVVATAPG
jgi:class 3 adenylate cyclase/tetratricopeptide (TPR) repeat protein